MSNIEKAFVRGFIKFLNKQITEKNSEAGESLEGKQKRKKLSGLFTQISLDLHDIFFIQLLYNVSNHALN